MVISCLKWDTNLEIGKGGKMILDDIGGGYPLKIVVGMKVLTLMTPG